MENIHRANWRDVQVCTFPSFSNERRVGRANKSRWTCRINGGTASTRTTIHARAGSSSSAQKIPCSQVKPMILRTETGFEAIERFRFLASFPLPDTGKREGGEKTQPFNRFASHPVMSELRLDSVLKRVWKVQICTLSLQ